LKVVLCFLLQINDAGNVLLDVWVRPKEQVTDFRFEVTGIRWSDLKGGISPEEASRCMHELTANCVLVGHALHNDIKVLPSVFVLPDILVLASMHQ
jgi:RNA exonuclease 4